MFSPLTVVKLAYHLSPALQQCRYINSNHSLNKMKIHKEIYQPKILPIARAGEPVLRQKTENIPVNEIPSFANTVADMLETFHSLGERVGLAAPQVFIAKSLMIYRIPELTHPRYVVNGKAPKPVPLAAYFNPTWKPINEEKVNGWEACVSIPGIMAKVMRYNHIEFSYYNLQGELQTKNISGFEARVVQHEVDHLEATLFTDKADPLTLSFEDIQLKQQAFEHHEDII